MKADVWPYPKPSRPPPPIANGDLAGAFVRLWVAMLLGYAGAVAMSGLLHPPQIPSVIVAIGLAAGVLLAALSQSLAGKRAPLRAWLAWLCSCASWIAVFWCASAPIQQIAYEAALS